MTHTLMLAHGVGGRTDLPLSAWQTGWSAAAALLVSFAVLGLAWHRPRLRELAVGRVAGSGLASIGAPVGVAARWIVGFGAVVVVTAGLVGVDDVAANLAPVTVYVAFWVAVPMIVVLIGPWWSSVSPWEAAFRFVDRLRVGRKGRTEVLLAGRYDGWMAVVPVAVFLWLELVYHDGARPRVLGWAGLGYTVALVGMALRWGTGVARRSEGFGVLFGLLARLSPIGRAPETGRPVIRLPLVGAAVDDLRPSEVALLLVVLGGTAFDGVSRTRFWGDVSAGHTGWGATAVGTVGLVWVVVVIAVAWQMAARLGDHLTGGAGFSTRFGHSLLPIVIGYHVAHYFSLLVLEGQQLGIRASDPYGRGWDLFGTAGDAVNWTRVSPATVGWVQLGAIVAGHLGGVLLAHDRSIESWRPSIALRSQYPLLMVMVVYTVLGLVLMTG